MAILGSDGYLRLRREAPLPLVFTPEAISPSANGFRTESQDYWSGDEVYLSSPNGLPLSRTAAPEGSGMYQGGIWDVGPNRVHVSDDSDQWYLTATEKAPGPPDGDPVAGDGAWFYNRGPAITSGTYYIYVDQMGRITFYTTRRDALFGSKKNRLPLFKVDFGFLVLAPSGTEEYDNSIAECADKLMSYKFPDIVDSATLQSICDFAPTYEQPVAGTQDYDNADIIPRNRIGTLFPWEFMCQMKSWTLETTGAAVDTTVVGIKFGENVKSLVTGGGTIDFMVDRIYESDASRDPEALMRLVLMTEKGSKASGQFYMILNRSAGAFCQGNALPGDLYYEADILITNIAINVRPDDVVAGTCQFVCTGPIELKAGPN